MKFSICSCLVLAAAVLPAQTPPATASRPAQPQVSLSVENTADTPPVVADDKVIMSVGDRKITYAQFTQIVNSLPEQSRDAARGAQRTQFANFVAQLLALADEGRKQKVDQTPAYKAALSFQVDNTLASLEYAQMGKDNTPDDALLKKYYADHQAEYVQVHARHILIRFKGSAVPLRPGQSDIAEADALTKTLELRKRIAGGEDFAAIAEKESDDTGSGAKGGDLGTFSKGQMVPVFEEAAFALKPGQLSDPVKSQFGYHLIKVESHDSKPFDEVRSQLQTQLQQERLKTALDDLLKKAQVVLDPTYFPAVPAQK
jgi:peptidyl-prolyl cis-trans isomerase C